MPPKYEEEPKVEEEPKIEEEEVEQEVECDVLNDDLTGGDNDIKPSQWDDDFEKICAHMIDEAQINTFLHIKSFNSYSAWSSAFQIPIIILSAIVGSANFASNTFGKYRDNIILIIGGVSILIAIISSIAQYLKLSELKESHRMSSFHWEKFYNKLKVQLMLKREYRRRLPDFYDDVLTEYQRLKEISPIFLKRIEKLAKKKDGYQHLNIPFYLNGFSPVIPYEKAQENYEYYYLTNNHEKEMSNFIYKKPRNKTLKKEIEIINKHKALSNKTTPTTTSTPTSTPTLTTKITPNLKKKVLSKDKNKYNPDDAKLDLGLIDTKLFQDTSIV